MIHCKMNVAGKKFLMKWAFAQFLGMMVFQFIHECGHGFGSQLDGLHVSTGFSRVGDLNKYPGDSDFRSEKMVTGTPGSGGFLGPLTN